MPEVNQNNDDRPTDAEIRDALNGIATSDVFASSPLLQRFLTYVVEETLAGRATAIRGKTIAADVYDRGVENIESGENLVRVEARRLRRLLADYYAGPGQADPWQIRIDLGGYVPTFAPADSKDAAFLERPSARVTGRNKRMFLAASLVLMALAGIAAVGLWQSDTPEAGTTGDAAIRAALRNRSVPALQAVNLADQARGMLFPVFDIRRQEVALEMFEYAIDLDPGLHQGYAGAAQVLATLSLFTADSEMSATFLADAHRMAEKALEISPESAWAHGSNGFVLALSGLPEDALNRVRLAVTLAPDDGHILDLAGMTAIVLNLPDLAAEVSDPARARSGVGRFGANNIWGVSQYMLGNYKSVIEAFSSAPNTGAPVSPPSLVFLAVAFDHAGEADKADRLVRELTETWPDLPVSFLIERVFQNGPEYRNDILERLSKHGYREK